MQTFGVFPRQESKDSLGTMVLRRRRSTRAFAVKVAPKRLPVFPFSGFDLYHHFRNDAFYGLYNLLKVQKTGKREVVLGQPLPQTLYPNLIPETSYLTSHTRDLTPKIGSLPDPLGLSQVPNALSLCLGFLQLKPRQRLAYLRPLWDSRSLPVSYRFGIHVSGLFLIGLWITFPGLIFTSFS